MYVFVQNVHKLNVFFTVLFMFNCKRIKNVCKFSNTKNNHNINVIMMKEKYKFVVFVNQKQLPFSILIKCGANILSLFI